MHMIKCTRNDFFFVYINTYIKNELFVKIELLTGKKNSLTSYCDKSLKIEKKVFQGHYFDI